MQNYSIALSGLGAAQKALEIVGNNVANAATDGYHRQRIELSPAYASQVGSVLLGGGVNIAGVTRMIDMLLEQEVFRQQSSLGQVSQELTTLQTIEGALGEFSVGGSLSTTIDEFFSALQDLSSLRDHLAEAGCDRRSDIGRPIQDIGRIPDHIGGPD
jgi:flagellar hook-associated protein 1 FlgK